jgi:hypothetical protein
MTDLWQPNNARTRRVVKVSAADLTVRSLRAARPIDPAEIARILRDDRAIHRQQRPDGMMQPTPNELRWTLAIIFVTVLLCIWVAA